MRLLWTAVQTAASPLAWPSCARAGVSALTRSSQEPGAVTGRRRLNKGRCDPGRRAARVLLSERTWERAPTWKGRVLLRARGGPRGTSCDPGHRTGWPRGGREKGFSDFADEWEVGQAQELPRGPVLGSGLHPLTGSVCSPCHSPAPVLHCVLIFRVKYRLLKPGN